MNVHELSAADAVLLDATHLALDEYDQIILTHKDYAGAVAIGWVENGEVVFLGPEPSSDYKNAVADVLAQMR